MHDASGMEQERNGGGVEEVREPGVKYGKRVIVFFSSPPLPGE